MRAMLDGVSLPLAGERTGLGNYALALRRAFAAAGVSCALRGEEPDGLPDLIHLLASEEPPATAPAGPLVLTVHDLAWRSSPADYYPSAARYKETRLAGRRHGELRNGVSDHFRGINSVR